MLTSANFAEQQIVSSRTASWAYYSDLAGAYKGPQPGVFENDAEGIKVYGDGYRGGVAVHTVAWFPVLNRSFYVKWKANGAGGYMGITPYLTPDVTSAARLPPNGHLNGRGLTTHHSFMGSFVIPDDVWLYTRAFVTADGIRAFTAINDYDDRGGSVIDSVVQSVSWGGRNVRLVFRFGDFYGGAAAHLIIGELRVAPFEPTALTSQIHQAPAPGPVAVPPPPGKSVFELMSDLESPDPGIRAQAATRIGSLAKTDPQAKRAIPALADTLRSIQIDLGTYESAAVVAQALAGFGASAAPAIPYLCRIARNYYEGRIGDVSTAAVRALSQIGTRDVVECLADVVRSHPMNEVVVPAARALGSMGPAAQSAIPALSYRKTNPGGHLAGASISDACADALRQIRGY
jgi:hypothetical protein